MGKEIDPADIGKHPDLIKKAQADIVQCDVLVCGRCHAVFHLVELFREHKEKDPECKRSSTSSLHECDEAQTKVWAFLLWKSTQQNAGSPGGTNEKTGPSNAWKLYQTWVKLDESVRDTWVVAGKTIQSFAKTGTGSLHEMPVKITKTIVEKAEDQKPGTPNAQNRLTTPGRKPGDVKTAPGTVDPKSRTPGPAVTTGAKKPDAQTKPGVVSKRSYGKRTHPKTGEIGEEEVEKILAKRFSPVIKMHEYLVKWSKMSNEHNTWEPLTHLHSCQSVLEYFEVQLAKQKEQRAAAAARTLQQQRQEKAKAAGGTPGASASPGSASSPLSPSSMRPNRNSKTNALDRVKLWSAGIQDSSEEGSAKRKLDDSDNDAGADAEGSEGPKKLRADSSNAVSEALNKVSQSGSVKIVSVPASGGATAGVKASPAGSATVNGGTASSPTVKDSNAAEVVIIKSPKDGVPSGISKKPVGLVGGNTAISRGIPPRGEAKVKIVPKSEPGGIFKIKSETSPQASQQGGSPTSGPTTNASPSSVTVAASTPVTTTPRPVMIHTSASLATTTDPSSGVTTRFIRRNVDGTPQLVKQTIRKSTKIVSSTPGLQRQAVAGRPIGSSSGTVGTPRAGGTNTGGMVQGQQRSSLTTRVVTTPQARPTTRVISGTPANVVRTSTHPGSSEQKINALRKQGLNVVKRVVTTSSAAGKKLSKEEEDDGMMADGFPSNLPLPAPPSPPRALTLCPVTGKVLGQAEGEPTPVPSPENESTEDRKPAVKKEEAEQSTGAGLEAEQQQLVVAAGGEQTDMQVQQLMTNEDGSPIIVAGEDGTLYQVAGKNAEGQTILIAQGADGEQSCVLVTSQEGEEEAQAGAGGVLTLDAAVSEAVAVPQEGQQMTEEQAAQYQQTVDTNQQLTIQTEDSQDGQITAEVVQADQPSPGGTRRVVLLLPDGSFMMTEVNEEQYQSLNLVN
uniref:Chromo domain-containing protein n=1 Tax=Anopheles atroparvus TaxID=41427 RepID=A0AAG5DJ08_ANOAO